MTQAQKAARFRALHETGFILPNAWDAGTAKILVSEGFPAIATTSAGIAFALGRQDYQVMRSGLGVARSEMLARLCEIADAVPVPVSGDLEAGYGDRPELVAETIRLAIGVGLAGGNIEDKDPASGALYEEGLAVERIAAAHDAGGADFVLNARTDAMLLQGADGLATAIRRANRYLAAGADCVFVPGAADVETVRTLALEIAGPVNIVLGLAGGSLDARQMLAAGAKRITVGGAIARAALAFVQRAARELKQHGTLGFAVDQIGHADLNRLFGGN